MPLFCHDPGCGCIHPLLQQKELFIKVIDGGCLALLVLFKRSMQFGQYPGIVKLLLFIPAVGKSTCNPHGADGVQAVGILHNHSFFCIHDGGSASSLIG